LAFVLSINFVRRARKVLSNPALRKHFSVGSHFMKTLIYITLILLTLVSCKQRNNDKTIGKIGNDKIVTQTEKKWTMKDIKKYFKDSIAYRDGSRKFSTYFKEKLKDIEGKNTKPMVILAFDEDFIDTIKIDKNRKWLRISVLPCFEKPYCLILEQLNDKSELTLKITDGAGHTHLGFLSFLNKTNFSDSLYNNISKELHQLNFWELKKDTTCEAGLDGEWWLFEAIENGQYNFFTRWTPLHCGNQITKQLAEIGVRLKNKAQFQEGLDFQQKNLKRK
jgi:hypothetical protein